jgi:hypothetical protein
MIGQAMQERQWVAGEPTIQPGNGPSASLSLQCPAPRARGQPRGPLRCSIAAVAEGNGQVRRCWEQTRIGAMLTAPHQQAVGGLRPATTSAMTSIHDAGWGSAFCHRRRREAASVLGSTRCGGSKWWRSGKVSGVKSGEL